MACHSHLWHTIHSLSGMPITFVIMYYLVYYSPESWNQTFVNVHWYFKKEILNLISNVAMHWHVWYDWHVKTWIKLLLSCMWAWYNARCFFFCSSVHTETFRISRGLIVRKMCLWAEGCRHDRSAREQVIIPLKYNLFMGVVSRAAHCTPDTFAHYSHLVCSLVCVNAQMGINVEDTFCSV